MNLSSVKALALYEATDYISNFSALPLKRLLSIEHCSLVLFLKYQSCLPNASASASCSIDEYQISIVSPNSWVLDRSDQRLFCSQDCRVSSIDCMFDSLSINRVFPTLPQAPLAALLSIIYWSYLQFLEYQIYLTSACFDCKIIVSNFLSIR